MGYARMGGYCATKFAMIGFSEALRDEVIGRGVHVAMVCPGTTDTEFFRGEQPGGLLTHSPAWVARAILRTARWPRRDVIVLPYRPAHLAEPVLGGLLEHVLGEARRSQNHRLRADGSARR